MDCFLPTQGFTIGNYVLDFDIDVTVTTTVPGSGGAAATSTSQVLSVSPSLPAAVDSGRRVSARLLGDLLGYSQIPDLEGRYLMVPAQPGECARRAGLPAAAAS